MKAHTTVTETVKAGLFPGIELDVGAVRSELEKLKKSRQFDTIREALEAVEYNLEMIGKNLEEDRPADAVICALNAGAQFMAIKSKTEMPESPGRPPKTEAWEMLVKVSNQYPRASMAKIYTTAVRGFSKKYSGDFPLSEATVNRRLKEKIRSAI